LRAPVSAMAPRIGPQIAIANMLAAVSTV